MLLAEEFTKVTELVNSDYHFDLPSMMTHKLKTEGYKFPCDEAYRKWEEEHFP